MSRRNKRKRVIKSKILIFFIIISIIIISLISYSIYNKYHKTNSLTNNSNPNQSINTPKEEISKISLIMVGDALIHNSVYQDANRLANYKGYDFKPQIKLIKEKVTGYDIAYYNQETILGGTTLGLSSYPAFNSPQEVGDAMLDAGFNLVSLATNHTLDIGEKGVLSSREYWNKQKNVQAVGSYSSTEEKQIIESKILEKNGITYAMLNYTYGTNGIPVPKGKSYLINLWSDTESYESYKKIVENDINNLRDKVDVLIVAMHWGREYTHTLTAIEEKTANYLSTLGVDIIIGTHPHVIQPIKWVNNTLVFYSLGNFISGQTSSICSDYRCNIGLMSSLDITKTTYLGESTIKIDNIKNELIYTYHHNYKDFYVIPFSSEEIKSHLKDYQTIYKKYAKIIETDDETITTVPLTN